MRRGSLWLHLALLVISEVSIDANSENGRPQNDDPRLIPYEINEEYIRHISSIMNAYRNDAMGERLVIRTNSQVNTRYKTLKRNADLINSLLALPKGLYDAGR